MGKVFWVQRVVFYFTESLLVHHPKSSPACASSLLDYLIFLQPSTHHIHPYLIFPCAWNACSKSQFWLSTLIEFIQWPIETAPWELTSLPLPLDGTATAVRSEYFRALYSWLTLTWACLGAQSWCWSLHPININARQLCPFIITNGFCQFSLYPFCDLKVLKWSDTVTILHEASKSIHEHTYRVFKYTLEDSEADLA